MDEDEEDTIEESDLTNTYLNEYVNEDYGGRETNFDVEAPHAYASTLKSSKGCHRMESKKLQQSHKELLGQLASIALSPDSRLQRQEELAKMRFNASDNTFIPGFHK
jgi:hypothetical protein